MEFSLTYHRHASRGWSGYQGAFFAFLLQRVRTLSSHPPRFKDSRITGPRFSLASGWKKAIASNQTPRITTLTHTNTLTPKINTIKED